jgi:hypothetical protein
VLTICLNAQVHLGFRRMRDGVTAELDIRTAPCVSYFSQGTWGFSDILLVDNITERITKRMILTIDLE